MAELALGRQRLTGGEFDLPSGAGDGVELLLGESGKERQSGDAGRIHRRIISGQN
jgi:hypothetical protein